MLDFPSKSFLEIWIDSSTLRAYLNSGEDQKAKPDLLENDSLFPLGNRHGCFELKCYVDLKWTKEQD